MVDQNSIFGGMLTTLGAAKKTNCDALGIPWEPRYMLIGDANGTDPVPSPAQTKLINQRYRAQLNQLRVSPTDDNVLIAELVLPPDVGGWWIRELALEDKDGVFSAVANVAPSYKPLLAQGSGRNQVVRMHIITSGTSNIQLKIDPSVVLATREYVDIRIVEELSKLDVKQSVRVATTANISLSGLQTIDGIVLAAGDRVLVKNQAAAKDNGPYVAAVEAWTRAKDADNNAKVTPNLTVAVESGTTQADTIWQLVTDGPIIVGATALTFKDISDGFARLLSPSFLGNPTAPTPALFDNSKSLATTEFAQRTQGSYADLVTYPGSVDLTPSDVGRLVLPGGSGSTVTLPDASAVPQGSVITVIAGLNGATYKAKTGQSLIAINGALGPFTQPQSTISAFRRLSNGQGWALEGGDGALKYSPILRGPHWETQPQFDNSKALATTEFVNRTQGNCKGLVAVSANTVLTPEQVGSFVTSNVGAGAVNVGLPLVSSVVPGSMFVITHSSSSMSSFAVTTSGADLLIFDGLGGNSAPYPMAVGEVLSVVAVGGGWKVVGGNGAKTLKTGGGFSARLEANGYQKLPNGLIIQWIFATNLGSQGALSIWPIAFPNACLFAAVTCSNGSAAYPVSIGAKTNTQVGAFAGTLPANIGFIGIGY